MVAEYAKPLPIPLGRETSLPYWDAARRHELLVPRCTACGRAFFYPRDACPHCMSADIDWVQASGRGLLYSFTVIHQPAHPGFRADAPYIYALVELEEGPRMVSTLVDCPVEDARMEMPLVAVFDDVTPEVTLVKFRPADTRS